MEKVQIYSDIYILVKNDFGIHGDDGIFWCLFARMMQATKKLQDQVAQELEWVLSVHDWLGNNTSITPYAPMMRKS